MRPQQQSVQPRSRLSCTGRGDGVLYSSAVERRHAAHLRRLSGRITRAQAGRIITIPAGTSMPLRSRRAHRSSHHAPAGGQFRAVPATTEETRGVSVPPRAAPKKAVSARIGRSGGARTGRPLQSSQAGRVRRTPVSRTPILNTLPVRTELGHGGRRSVGVAEPRHIGGRADHAVTDPRRRPTQFRPCMPRKRSASVRQPGERLEEHRPPCVWRQVHEPETDRDRRRPPTRWGRSRCDDPPRPSRNGTDAAG